MRADIMSVTFKKRVPLHTDEKMDEYGIPYSHARERLF